MTPLSVRNSQPVEQQVYHPGGHLEVIAAWLTLQGEGPYSGTPAVFVRLAGCNLSAVCKSCDTEYTRGRVMSDPDQLLTIIENAGDDNTDLCVLTGGEPFRQNLAPLVRRLLRGGWRVQVETNGTLFLPDFPYEDRLVTLVCSPKTPSLHPHAAPFFGHLKYIVQAGQVDPEDGLPLTSLDSGCRPVRPGHLPAFRGAESGYHAGREVWVQPQDDYDSAQNELNTRTALESCFKFGYRLSLQIHKQLKLA
jgi:7-carboxy-7-deazaguanine synthase